MEFIDANICRNLRANELEVMKQTPLKIILEKFRKEKGVTQEMIAQRCGCSANYYQMQESGKRKMKLSMVDASVSVLKLNEEEAQEVYRAWAQSVQDLTICLDDKTEFTQRLIADFIYGLRNSPENIYKETL